MTTVNSRKARHQVERAIRASMTVIDLSDIDWGDGAPIGRWLAARLAALPQATLEIRTAMDRVYNR
jgi:hypothetical protein